MRLLLGGLLLTPDEPVAEQRLVEFVWGPSGVNSKGALHTLMSRLRTWFRQNLELSKAIERTTVGYRLCLPGDAADVARFHAGLRLAGDSTETHKTMAHLVAALDEWRGKLLPDAPEWVRSDPAVVQLERIRAQCACELADISARVGQPQVALGTLEQLAAAAPYDEMVHARWLLLLGACGRRVEALRWYEQIRRRLADELGVDPSAELRQVQTALLQGSDPPFATPGEAVIALARPTELPPDPPVFTGRCRELARISEMLTARPEHGIPLVAINGAAGVGKSALAIRAAHTVARRFGGGQLYVDLQGCAPGQRALAPEEVLGRFLRALGLPDHQVPRRAQEAATRFRSMVADRKLLIVLDDAADPAQIRPLLPADPDCAVLVTSRRVLCSLDGAAHVCLDLPPEAEAIALFADLTGRERVAREQTAARRIARATGCLPLALRVAAARLAARPDWSLQVLATRLAQTEHRLEELDNADLSVRRSLTTSYEQLGEGRAGAMARRLFCLLGLLDRPDFRLPVAVALTDLPTSAVQRALERLVEVRLLQPTKGDRYALNPLIHLFAHEQAERHVDEPDRLAALTRVLDATAECASDLTPTAATGSLTYGRCRSDQICRLD